MSLKRVLGMMLASRMAGRGRGRGMGGGLGTAAMLGGLGGRRMGGKLGLAAMGYMAWQAYRDHQSRAGAGGADQGSSRGPQPGGAGFGSGTGSGGLGGIGDMIRDVADRVTGGAISGGAMGGGATGGAGDPGAAGFREEERAAAESFSEDKALLLLRAMIAAAYSDGALSQDERQRLMGEIESGGDAEDRRTMEREIANPRPVDELLAQVHDHETAEEFYLASRAAIDGETPQNRAYLSSLRQRLGLSEQDAAEVERIAS